MVATLECQIYQVVVRRTDVAGIRGVDNRSAGQRIVWWYSSCRRLLLYVVKHCRISNLEELAASR
jgi:hypothetical protein